MDLCSVSNISLLIMD
jgi:meckelin